MLRLLSPSRDVDAVARVCLALPSVVAIARQFTDPKLELARLLREAANVEHALMVQYLFGAFSLKERYSDLAGTTAESTANLFGIAVQEMRHLARVNELLVAIGAQPNLDREDFPFRSDVYPFPLELEPLTRSSVAKYVTAEAPADALDPDLAPTPEERKFRESVIAEAGSSKVNHIGSLYGLIIKVLGEAVAANPSFLPNSQDWLSTLDQIRGQGEHDHFLFFRAVFEGTHPVLGNPHIWSDPSADTYPSLPLAKNPTAVPGDPRAIPDELSRRLAWLGNLHYWTVLGLLFAGHAAVDSALIGAATSHMISCLHKLGLGLAARGVGVPFDALALNFGFGPDRNSSRKWLATLVREIQFHEQELEQNLPEIYSRSVAVFTLRMLEGSDDLLS